MGGDADLFFIGILISYFQLEYKNLVCLEKMISFFLSSYESTSFLLSGGSWSKSATVVTERPANARFRNHHKYFLKFEST